MRKSLADRIEEYLKVLISRSEEKEIEIQRAELAETFCCVPSQVTYVISTRFTQAEGYHTESRRGGRGYVRIGENRDDYSSAEWEEQPLFLFIDELLKKELISNREADMLKFVSVMTCKDLPLEYKNKVCKSIIKGIQQFIINNA